MAPRIAVISDRQPSYGTLNFKERMIYSVWTLHFVISNFRLERELLADIIISSFCQ